MSIDLRTRKGSRIAARKAWGPDNYFHPAHGTDQIGARVFVVNNPARVGVVERLASNPPDGQVFVRWHKGFAGWEEGHKLRLAPTGQ